MMGNETRLPRILPLKKTYTLDIRGKTIKIGPEPWLMGIVNVTPIHSLTVACSWSLKRP